jgi:phage host-nuclease inhibitor protein Gam
LKEKNMEIKTWEEADRWLQHFVTRKARLNNCEARRDEELAALRNRHQYQIDLASQEVSDVEAALKKFAAAHKAEFQAAPNGDGRSYEHAGAVLGFRQSPGRVEIRNEEKTIEWLRDCRNGRFVRLVHEPNREALLQALRPSPDGDQRLIESLAAHGITFQQKDKFFLELNKEP